MGILNKKTIESKKQDEAEDRKWIFWATIVAAVVIGIAAFIWKHR